LTITTREKQSFLSVELVLDPEDAELTEEVLDKELEWRFDLNESVERLEKLNIVRWFPLDEGGLKKGMGRV
jgi:hypothetical protein